MRDDSFSDDNTPPPKVEIVRIRSLANRTCLAKVTCLQMTDTGLFLNWDHDTATERDNDDALFYQSIRDRPQYASASPLFLFCFTDGYVSLCVDVSNDVQVVLVDMNGELLLLVGIFPCGSVC